MKIEAGKYYKARNGEKYGPMFLDDTGWIVAGTIDGYMPMWLDCGRNYFFTEYSRPEYDLIAEWVDEPPVQYSVGMKVRALVDECDITKGNIYTVANVDPNDDVCPIMVIDDVGDMSWFEVGQFEIVDDTPQPEEQSPVNYAEQAAIHKIKITFAAGNVSVSYDGRD